MHWSARCCLLICILNLARTDLLSVLASNYEHHGAEENDAPTHKQGTANFDPDIGAHDARNARNTQDDLNDKQEVREVHDPSDVNASEGDGSVIGAEEPVEGHRQRRSVIDPRFYRYGRIVKERRGEVLPHHRIRMEDVPRLRRELFAGKISATEMEGVLEVAEHKRSLLNTLGRGTYEVKIPSSAARKRREAVYSASQHRRRSRPNMEAENEKPKVRFGREEEIGSPLWTGRFGRELRDKAPLWKSRYGREERDVAPLRFGREERDVAPLRFGREERDVAPLWKSRYGREAQEKSLIMYGREARDKSPFWKGRYGREEGHETPFWNGRYGRVTARERPPWVPSRFGRDAEEIKDFVRQTAPPLWRFRIGRGSNERGGQITKQKRLEAAINMEFTTGESHSEGGHTQHLPNDNKNEEELQLENADTQPSVRFGRAVVNSADTVDVDGTRTKRRWRDRSGRASPRIVNHQRLPQRSHSSGKKFINHRPIMYADLGRVIGYGEDHAQGDSGYEPKVESWPGRSRSQEATALEKQVGEGNERADADRDAALEENDDLAGTGFDGVDGVASTKDREAEDRHGNRFVYQMERLRQKIRDTEMKEGLATTREGTGFFRGKSNRGTAVRGEAGRPRSRNLKWRHTRDDEHMKNTDDYYEHIKDTGL